VISCKRKNIIVFKPQSPLIIIQFEPLRQSSANIQSLKFCETPPQNPIIVLFDLPDFPPQIDVELKAEIQQENTAPE
jgi:hypothetical protein